MKKNISFEQIKAELIAIFDDAKRMHEYNDTAAGTRYIIPGALGMMTPANRSAFIKEFGEALTATAEEAAREAIADREQVYNQSRHATHCEEADRNAGRSSFVPVVGCFVWAVASWLKNEGRGFRETVATCARREQEEGEPRETNLTKVVKVINVSESEFNDPATPDRLTASAAAAGDPFAGGSMSDDIDELQNQYNPTREEMRVFYMVAVAVVSPSGRWFLIDCEGYEYARYLLLPSNWRTMYAEEIREAEREEIERKNREQEEEAREAEKRRAAYLDRCAKWSPLMVAVSPFEKKYDEIRAAKGWNDRETKQAERAAHNATRKNILTMCRAAFPGVKFSLRKNSGWGADWYLSYTDGPTLEEFREKTDLDLFEAHRDTFDGMTDCAGVESAEFTQFATDYAIFGTRGGIDVKREESEEITAENLAKICEAFPELSGSGYDWPRVSFDVLPSVCAALVPFFGADVIDRAKDTIIYNGWDRSATEIQRQIFNVTSYYSEQTTPTTPDDNGPEQDRTSNDGEGIREGSTPSGSLVMVNYSAKACAVFGDTAPHKDVFKQMGGRFNPRLKYNGETRAGWIFSKTKAEQVAAFVAASVAPVEILTNEEETDSTAKASAALSDVVELNPTGPTTETTTDREQVDPLPAAVVPSSTIADAIGSACTYGACEKSQEETDSTAKASAALSDVVELNPTGPTTETTTDREQVDPLPTVVVPSSTIADAIGSACMYGVCEKSQEETDSTAKASAALSDVVELNPTGPTTETTTDREQVDPLPASVVPSSTIADAIGSACTYGACEKSLISKDFDGSTIYFKGADKYTQLFNWDILRACLVFSAEEAEPLRETLSICRDYIQDFESNEANPLGDKTGSDIFRISAKLHEIGDTFSQEKPADHLWLSGADGRERCEEQHHAARRHAFAAALPLWKELHDISHRDILPLLNEWRGVAYRPDGMGTDTLLLAPWWAEARTYEGCEKSPHSKVGNYHLSLEYKNEEGKTITRGMCINCAFEDLRKLTGIPHPAKGLGSFKCSDLLVLDTSLIAINMLNDKPVSGLYFLDNSGHKQTPNTIYFGIDSRWCRPDSGQINGFAYCHFDNALRPVYLSNGERFADHTLCNVSASYKDGVISGYYRE